MKAGKGLWICITAVLALVIALPAFADDAADKVATVNGTVIARSDLDRKAERLQQQYKFMGRPADDSALPEIRKEALEQIIKNELLYQESVKKGIEVDAEAIQQHLSTMKSRFQSEEEFNERIARENLTMEDLEREFTRRKAVQSLIEKEVIPNVTVSEEESKSYYDENPAQFLQPAQVKASHILIKMGPDMDEEEKTEKREEINKIKQKLDEGADFTETAKEFSQGPSAPKGGDLGYFSHDRMVRPFADAAFALEVGEVSDIVVTQFGYHLIKVFDKKDGSATPFETVKRQVEEMLKSRKIGEAVTLHAKKLEEEATIERFLP